MSRGLAYGPHPSQAGDLHLPSRGPAPVVCLLHGGFWRMPYGREQMTAVARDLRDHGFAAWNVGYRRLGEPGVGWPEIAADVRAAIDFLEQAREGGAPIDLSRVAVAGHSAGGQLALACTSAKSGPLRVRPAAVVAMAAITDLEAAQREGLGKDAAGALLGGAPQQVPDRYAAASPLRLLPHGTRQLLLHGEGDAAVPPAQSRAYARAARAAGDDVTHVELARTDHMAFLDPASMAHARWRAWLAERHGVSRP